MLFYRGENILPAYVKNNMIYLNEFFKTIQISDSSDAKICHSNSIEGVLESRFKMESYEEEERFQLYRNMLIKKEIQL